MQNYLIFIISLCSIINLSAQEEIKQRNTSFGIDLLLPIVSLSGFGPNEPDIELQVKHFFKKSALRLEVTIPTNSTSEVLSQISTLKINDMELEQFYILNNGIGIGLGFQRQITSGKFPFYLGFDAAHHWEKGFVRIEGCILSGFGQFPCNEFVALDANSTYLEFTPFCRCSLRFQSSFFY